MTSVPPTEQGTRLYHRPFAGDPALNWNARARDERSVGIDHEVQRLAWVERDSVVSESRSIGR